jgi:hypothetical protein
MNDILLKIYQNINITIFDLFPSGKRTFLQVKNNGKRTFLTINFIGKRTS